MSALINAFLEESEYVDFNSKIVQLKIKEYFQTIWVT